METAEVVVVGGGVHGCAIAYYLSSLGCTDVMLMEKGYLAGGATGRSAAGIRHQFGTRVNCRLALENVKMFSGLKDELDYPWSLEFEQGGYLLLAFSESQLQVLRNNVSLQRTLGIDSQILGPHEVISMFPLINPDGLWGASFCAKDGHASPWHVTWAYARAALRAGVKIRRHCEVTAIRRVGSGFVVHSNVHDVSCRAVVNAAGAQGAVSVGKMVGLELPIYSERHQAAVTEPVERVLPCMILSFEDGTWCKQTPSGNFIMGIGDPNEEKGFNMAGSWQFLHEVALKVSKRMPDLKGLRVIRQWAGLYDITPDSQAILGPVEEVPGYFLDVGWSGHGFQFAPSAGLCVAQQVLGMETSFNIEDLAFSRFAQGKLIPEPTCL